MAKPSRELVHARTRSNEDRRQNSPRFTGIGMREWGSWVSEIRTPKTRKKIWLGSYKTAEQAARAYDAAVYCLRGANAKFNFPNSVPAIPSASSLSPQQIKVAAAKYALDEIPSTSPPLHNNETIEGVASPSQPSSVSETDWSYDSRQISEALGLGLWDSPFDSNGCLNLEKIPSIEQDFIAAWPEEQQQEYLFFDPTDFWNF